MLTCSPFSGLSSTKTLSGGRKPVQAAKDILKMTTTKNPPALHLPSRDFRSMMMLDNLLLQAAFFGLK